MAKSFFWEEKEAVDGQEVRLHSVEIRLEVHTVRNYLNFATKYRGKNPEHLIKSQILSITFVLPLIMVLLTPTIY